MSIRQFLARFYWILTVQVGIDPRKFFQALKGIPRYIRNFIQFKLTFKGRIEFVPCLHDWFEEGGSTKNEYFWQDLVVARMIFLSNPLKHVDIGSRVDGFIAHVASFREIEVLDIRPVTSLIPGVTFKEVDLMNPTVEVIEYCDSLSCLHTLEHFGLGRYGDKIDPGGYEVGFRNMVDILRPGGVFYLSVPVGIERVEFNANRVFNPNTITSLAKESGLKLKEFSLFTAKHGLVKTDISNEALYFIGEQRYGLGIFTFIKNGVS